VRIFIVFLVAVYGLSISQSYTQALRAYLTSKGFDVFGEVFAYDFNGNGQIEYNDWVVLSFTDKEVYQIRGVDPDRENPLGLKRLKKIKLNILQPSGYLVKGNFVLDKPQKSYFYLSLVTSNVYKVFSTPRDKFLKYLLIKDMTYNIDDHKAFILHKDPDRYENILNHFDTKGFTWSVEMDDTYIYLADGANGLVVLGNDLKNLKKVDHIPTPGHSYKVEQSGKKLFVANGKSGVCCVKKDKFFPKRGIKEDVEDLDVRKGLLLAVSPKNGFYLYRLTSSKPLLIKSFKSSCAIGGKIEGDRVYMLDGCKGLSRYDIKESKLSRLVKKSGLKSFEIAGKRYIAYARWDENAFYIYDIATKKEKKIETLFNIHRLKYYPDKRKIFVLNKTASISLWDLEDLDIKFVKNIYLPYPAMDLKLDQSGKIAYIADGGNGLVVVKMDL